MTNKLGLPAHAKRMCIGIHLHGTAEPCGEPVEHGSLFPFCAVCREAIESMPRRQNCAGAMTVDAAMRPLRVPCARPTGSPARRLCPSCEAVEARGAARVRKELTPRCPTCGQPEPAAHPNSGPKFHRPYNKSPKPNWWDE